MKTKAVGFLAIALLVLVGGFAFAVFTQPEITKVVNITLPQIDLPINIPALPPQKSEIEKRIETMTLRDKVSGLLILHASGTNAAKLAEYVQTHKPAGLILMGDNIPSPESSLRAITDALQRGSEYPYLIAIDQEGCTVRRLRSDAFGCASTLRQRDASSTEAAFKSRSELLQRLGVNLNFGIVADMTNDRRSFIYPRVFGGDPKAVADRVGAAVRGTDGLSLSTLKHFPGHGVSTADSHTSIPTTSLTKPEWEKTHAVPFKEGIKVGADLVMFGHLAYASVDRKPATLSAEWHRVLRDELGFDGVTITDDMIMLQNTGRAEYRDPVKNAVEALNAGNDILLYVNDHGGGASRIEIPRLIDGIVAAVSSGKIDEKEIDEKLERVLTIRDELK